jgi:hypothetical protein
MDNNQSKSCTKCKTEKTLENYYRNKNHSDGCHATCKECWSYKKKSAPKEIQDSSKVPVPNKARSKIRPTNDIDLVIEISKYTTT